MAQSTSEGVVWALLKCAGSKVGNDHFGHFTVAHLQLCGLLTGIVKHKGIGSLLLILLLCPPDIDRSKNPVLDWFKFRGKPRTSQSRNKDEDQPHMTQNYQP